MHIQMKLALQGPLGESKFSLMPCECKLSRSIYIHNKEDLGVASAKVTTHIDTCGFPMMFNEISCH